MKLLGNKIGFKWIKELGFFVDAVVGDVILLLQQYTYTNNNSKWSHFENFKSSAFITKQVYGFDDAKEMHEKKKIINCILLQYVFKCFHVKSKALKNGSKHSDDIRKYRRKLFTFF